MADRPFEIIPPPDADTVASGLLVWVPAGDCGDIPAGWREVLAARDIVWAGANECGNGVDATLRVSIAIDAAAEAARRHRIEPGRAYVGGFSGGAKVASAAAMRWPDVFTGGALLVAGAAHHRDIDVPEDRQVLRAAFDLLGATPNRRQRYALVVGADDQWLSPMRAVAVRLRRDGFAGVALLEIPGVGHRLPPADWFAKAIESLDRSRALTR